MEVCMKKPEVKKNPQPTKLLHMHTELKRNELERREKPTPVVPPRPTHAEMIHTQYRTKISATSNSEQQAIKEKPSETPVVPSRPTEKELKATSRYHEPRKSSRETDQPASVDEEDFQQSVMSGMFRRSQREKTPTFISYMTDTFDELEKRDDIPVKQAPKPGKGGFFGLLRKTPKAAAEENLASHEVSGSNESLTEAGSTKKSQDEPSSSSEAPTENVPKEKGGLFSGKFKKPPKPAEEDGSSDTEVRSENSSENKLEKSGGLFSGFIKKISKGERTETPDRETQRELSASSEDLSENNTEKSIFSNMFRKTPKPAEGTTEEMDVNAENQLSASTENLTETHRLKEKKGGLALIFKRSLSLDNLFDEDKDIFSKMFKKTPKPADKESNTCEDKKLFESSENLLEVNTTKEKTGRLAGIFKKSPKPSPRSVATQDPLSDSKQLSDSWDSLSELGKEDVSAEEELSASKDNLSDATNTTKEKRVFGIFRPTKYSEQQEDEETQPLTGARLKPKRTIKKKRRVVSFRIKTTLPKMDKQSSEKMPVVEETVELQDMDATQENTVLVQPADLAAYPTEEDPGETQQEINELMEWWNTVKGWTEWNESSNFQAEDEEMAMEQAADRVYMAARVFVHLFNQQGASLQQRILELMALADAADEFHKKTVSAAVGGGVASVAGSVATITGLILAPFTFGASIIVTAVGIGVATAGSITSATANITDTVHSNMDRKKVEKMIQGYQEEITDIRKCLQFVQEGMDTLQEWDFDKYSQSAANKALNHNIKHVMKEGGRAGKAIMINTEKLISTVQVLGAAGGAAKAAKAISVTTGVMSALFLALDIFFLAKDSHELRKGAKTKFAGKLRQVCKELQEGLLEMNKVKTQLQKTMDGIELEEYEEIEEVEVEVEVEDDLESDSKKLAELEQEIDFLEKKLDNKDDKKQKKSKERGKDIFLIKKDKKEKSGKEKGELEETKEKENIETNTKTEENGENMMESKLEKIPDETLLKAVKQELWKEHSHKGHKQDKESENKITGEEKKHERKHEKTKEDTNKITEWMEKKKNKAEKEQEETKSRSGDSEKDESLKPQIEEEKTNRKNERRRSSREDEGGMKSEKKTEGRSTRRHSSSRSDRDKDKARDSDRTDSWRSRGQEERGVKDWKAEVARSKEEKRGTDRRTESHRRHKEEMMKRERETLKENSREETRPSRYKRRDKHRETRGDEKLEGRVASARRRFEKAAGEEEEERSKRTGRDREHEHNRAGSRRHSKTLRENGLCI